MEKTILIDIVSRDNFIVNRRHEIKVVKKHSNVYRWVKKFMKKFIHIYLEHGDISEVTLAQILSIEGYILTRW